MNTLSDGALPGRLAILVLLVLLSVPGCVGSPRPQSPGGFEEFPRLRYAIGVEEPVDRRDFSRLELLAPELGSYFDPVRDAYGFESGYNPFTIEFLSGVPFRWDEPLEETLLRVLVDELSREDLFLWVEPVPTTDPPDYYLLVSILHFHYERGDRVFYPQVGLEALVLDGRDRQVVHKTRSRVTDEYGILDETGTLSRRTYMLEDWLAAEFRERSRRAMERGVEKLRDRLLDYFYREAEKEDQARSRAAGGGGGE